MERSSKETPPEGGNRSDRCSPKEAAGLVGVTYPTQFAKLVHGAERVLNPDTLALSEIPERYRVKSLTPAERRALSPSDLYDYVARKADAAKWERELWIAVPRWGGIKPPFGERTYSRSKCQRWYALANGNGEDGQLDSADWARLVDDATLQGANGDREIGISDCAQTDASVGARSTRGVGALQLEATS